jgi:hypothetical protein
MIDRHQYRHAQRSLWLAYERSQSCLSNFNA